MNGDWFAGRLRELREAAGMTQQQLANRAGMAWRTITHLETGDRKPSWETVLALCQALGLECAAFVQQPADREPPGRGRPPKATPALPPAEKLEKAAKQTRGKRTKGRPNTKPHNRSREIGA